MSDVPTCDACGVPFIQHLGIIGTCQKVQDLTKQNRHLEHTASLAKERGDKAEADRAEMKRLFLDVFAAWCSGVDHTESRKLRNEAFQVLNQ